MHIHFAHMLCIVEQQHRIGNIKPNKVNIFILVKSTVVLTNIEKITSEGS